MYMSMWAAAFVVHEHRFSPWGHYWDVPCLVLALFESLNIQTPVGFCTPRPFGEPHVPSLIVGLVAGIALGLVLGPVLEAPIWFRWALYQATLRRLSFGGAESRSTRPSYRLL